MLPSLASKNRYIVLCLQMLCEGYDELQIMSDFMRGSCRRLYIERMHKPEENDSKKETGQQSQCAKCGKTGHRTVDCWRAKKPTKSHGTKQSAVKQSGGSNSQQAKPCPACNLQHRVKGQYNNFYSSRLYLCPTFQNLSIQDKTKVVKDAKVCTLCLDWRGLH